MGSWASGLHDLLDALDKQSVPRSEDEAAINPSWENYRRRLAIKIEKAPEVLTSNWLRIASVPDTIRYYYPPGSINHALMEEACHESTMPAELYQRGFFSFASPEEIERESGNVGKFEIQSEHELFELMECGSQSPHIRAREAQNLITSLFRRAWENFCRSKGLYEYGFATQSGCQVLFDAFRNRRTCYRIGLDLRHQRGSQRFRLLQIREPGTLPWDYVSTRRATVNPDRAVAVHPKPSFCSWNTTLVNRAVGEVSLVQNQAFSCLRHPSSVRVLVHGVKSTRQTSDYKVIGSPAWIRTTIHGSKGRCPTIRRPGNTKTNCSSV